MRIFIALRLLNDSQAKATIEGTNENAKVRNNQNELIDLNVTRFHPALRNINEYLRDHEILPEFRRPERARRGRPSSASKQLETKQLQATTQGDCRLVWCEVETDLTAEAWMSVQGVEAVIAKEDFNKFVLSIRCKSGAAYIAACEDYARKLPIGRSEPRRSKAA